jgi:hypothetical protein
MGVDKVVRSNRRRSAQHGLEELTEGRREVRPDMLPQRCSIPGITRNANTQIGNKDQIIKIKQTGISAERDTERKQTAPRSYDSREMRHATGKGTAGGRQD